MDAAAVVEPKPAAAQTEGAREIKGATIPSPVKEDTIVNRETKLALLIGFVAIVVVTVLVGEHFGKARNATVATTDLGTSTAAAPSATGLTVDPITATPVATPSAAVNQPGSPGAVQPVTLLNGGAPALTSGNANTVTPPAVINTDPNRFMPAAGVDTTGISPSVADTEIPGTRPVGTMVDPTSPTLGGRTISTGVEKMHPVQRGETVAALAQKYYGDKSFTKQLTAYNAKRLSANGTVREGVTLRIPPKDVLMGDAVLSPTSAGRTDSSVGPVAAATKPAAPKGTKASADKAKAEKPTTEKAKATGPRTYVVKKGDTLMSIASKELGSAKRWEALLVANPSIDENSLRAGMTIKIPATK